MLLEAIRYGCNVVTSPNVGNWNFVNMTCIVKQYAKTEDWVQTICRSLKRSLPFIGYDCNHIKNQLINLFQYVYWKKNL